VTDTVTLSSFHGCPADEIERIVEHLIARHGLNVVVKLNPTLLGHDAVDALLHGKLGWDHVRLDRGAFENDLQWDHALSLLGRLRGSAARHGRALGIKLTNTLVVRNTRGRLAGDVVYLSGPPLHPIAIRLADRLARATGGAIPIALSAGVNAENFADAVACGFSPVTTCTDLLRPTGYRRLPRYLKALEADMEHHGAPTVDAYLRARAVERGEVAVGARAAALGNLEAYASRVASDERYGAGAHPAPELPRSPLALVDCESCNQCTLACPNGAIFDVASPAGGEARR
jgi:putative selenate reductase